MTMNPGRRHEHGQALEQFEGSQPQGSGTATEPGIVMDQVFGIELA